jgi:hypothetical protein
MQWIAGKAPEIIKSSPSYLLYLIVKDKTFPMKSINPEDFKVVNKIELSKLPTNLDSDAVMVKKKIN